MRIRPWALQRLDGARFAAHVRAGEVLFDPDGPAVAIMPHIEALAEDDRPHLALLAGDGLGALRLMLAAEAAAGQPIGVRLIDPAPMFDDAAIVQAWTDAGLSPREWAIHVLERQLPSGDPLPPPEPDGALVLRDAPSKVAVPPPIGHTSRTGAARARERGQGQGRHADRRPRSGPLAGLPKALRDEVGRLGTADIMVGIPSFRNAATIGHVVRAAQAGLVQYFPDLRPVLVNADAGSPDGTQRVVVETEPPDYIARILLVRPRNRLRRISLTYPEVDGVGGKGAALRTLFQIARALQGPGARRRRLGPALDRAGVDRAAGRTHPQGRLRLRDPALLAPQVRRHDHQHGHLPAHAGALRAAHPPADRRRLRRQRRPHRPLPGAGRLDAGRQQVRHRHLDDDDRRRRRLRGLPGAAGRQGPRPQGPRRRPGADVQPGRRHAAAPDRAPRRSLARRERLARRAGLRLRAHRRPAAAGGGRRAPAARVRRRTEPTMPPPGPRSASLVDAGPPGRAGRRSPRAVSDRRQPSASASRSPTRSGRASSTAACSPITSVASSDERLIEALVPLYFGRVASHVLETGPLDDEAAEAVVERRRAPSSAQARVRGRLARPGRWTPPRSTARPPKTAGRPPKAAGRSTKAAGA